MVAIDQFLKSYAHWTNYQFSGLLYFCLQIFIWYLVHWFAILRYRSSWVWFRSIDFFFRSFVPWTYKNVTNYQFPDFCSLFLQIFIWYLVHCFAILRYRSSLSLNFSKSYGHWTRRDITNYQFSRHFSLCLQVFIWYLVHWFSIPRYRSSLSLVSIH
jgi:hypothetical protein